MVKYGGAWLHTSAVIVVVTLATLVAGGTVLAQEDANDTLDSADPISQGNTTGVVSASDQDVYKIEGNTTDALDIRVFQSQFVNFRLYAPNRTQIDSGSNQIKGGTARTVKKLPDNGTYYIEVVRGSASTQPRVNYTLQVDRVTPAENDPYAPNSEFDSAAVITDRSSNGTIWGGESDYFRVGLNSSEAISVSLTPESGFLTLRVYDPNKSEIGSDDPFLRGGTATVNKTASTQGTYYVVVDGSGRNEVDYELTSNRTGTLPQQPTSVVDRFDTNNDGDISPREAQGAIVALNNGQIVPSDAQQVIVALNS